jgi:hypothetical protein
MGLKIGSKSAVVQRKLIAGKKFSVVGRTGENNLLAGFEVTVNQTDTWVPVVNGQYLRAWTKVYQLIKQVL